MALLKSFTWIVLANLSRQVAFLIVNAVLFERLSRSTFGALALAFGYMTVFIGLGDFGIRQIGWRDVARHPEKARVLTGPLLGVKLVTVAVAGLVWVLLMPVLWEPGAPPAIYLLYGLGIAFNLNTFDFLFYGLSRMDLIARYTLTAFTAYLLGCLLLVTSDGRAWLVPSLFAGAMGLLLALELRWFRQNLGPLGLLVRRAETCRTLRQAWPLGLGEVLNRSAGAYPLILIGIAVGTEGVGNYRIADLLFSFLAQFGTLFASAGFSRVSHTFHHRRSELSSVVTRMLWMLIGAALLGGSLVYALGPRLFALVFAGTGEETLAVLRVLGIALVFAAPARFLKALLASIDRQGALLAGNAITLVVGVSVGWLAVAAHGIVGMAIGLLAAELATLLMLAAVYWKSLREPVPWSAEPGT